MKFHYFIEAFERLDSNKAILLQDAQFQYGMWVYLSNILSPYNYNQSYIHTTRLIDYNKIELDLQIV